MENLLLNSGITKCEILSYFSTELICIIAIVLNLIFFIFYKRKLNVKRISDFITSSAFAINSLILAFMYFANSAISPNIDLTLFNGFLDIDNGIVILKFLINIFMLFFVLTTYKITRKVKFKTPIINSILIFLALMGNILVEINSFILTYILLDISAISIYKYASEMRIRKDDFYSTEQAVISAIGTFLFSIFYIAVYSLTDDVQMNIVQVCIFCAVLLKIGIFPVYNYLINRQYKTNIPYSILLFCYLPVIGVFAFAKMAEVISYTNEIFQISLAIFVTISMVSFAIYAFSAKNIVRYIANSVYFWGGLCILNVLFKGEYLYGIKLITAASLAAFGLFSLVVILKTNYNLNKINISCLKNIFFKNRGFAFLFSILLLASSAIAPAAISKYASLILSNIYTFDKYSIFLLAAIIFGHILFILKSLNIVKNIYSFDKNNIPSKIIIAAIFNYTAAIIVVVFLIMGILL